LRTWPHSTSSVDCTGCLPSCTVLMGLPLSYHVLDLKTIMPAIARFGEDGDRIKTDRQAVVDAYMDFFAAVCCNGDLQNNKTKGVGGQAFDPHPHLGGVIGLV